MRQKQSFCWHCGKKLKLPYFAEVTDPIGNAHKVHKVCVNDAKDAMRAMPHDESYGLGYMQGRGAA
jgi:hypothetical protein